MGILRTAFDTSVVRHFICQSDSDVIGESHSKKPKDFLKTMSGLSEVNHNLSVYTVGENIPVTFAI